MTESPWKESSFLKSALTLGNPRLTVEGFHDWMRGINASADFEVERVPFARLNHWSFDPATGDLGHDSGKFFRIEGVHVRGAAGAVAEWDQPIINQPEIGILGMITRVEDGVRYFLMQAKVEPGNVNCAQLSPTVQATRSNFTQVHHGRLPLFLEYFLERARARVLVDQLQSEQGARFLRKRNRNMIVEIDEEIPVPDNFCWLTLGQIKELVLIDDLVNMDARSVMSCIPFFENTLPAGGAAPNPENVRLAGRELSGFGRDVFISMLGEYGSRYATEAVANWFRERKARCGMEANYKALNELEGWVKTADEIGHESGEHFSVIAVSVHANGREVDRWTQPLIAHPHVGLIGCLAQKFNGVLHFLARAHAEPGTVDRLEMSPTVICSNPLRNRVRPGSVPLLERLVDAPVDRIRLDVVQSEEGGRFFRVRNRYRIVELPESEALEVPDDFIWLTLRQMIAFTQREHWFNVEARGLLSCLGFLGG